ncbi:MAG: 3'-5' exonuclease [Ghiorsea sp.]
MVDLETLSTQCDATLISIGAVMFDPEEHKFGRQFYSPISTVSCKELGLHVDKNTINWWMKQTKDAQRALIEAKTTKVSITDALVGFSNFLSENKSKYIWCRGANFDAPILSTIYKKLGIVEPFKFYDVLCHRTYTTLSEYPRMPFKCPTPHHALDDAKLQVEWMWKIAGVE